GNQKTTKPSQLQLYRMGNVVRGSRVLRHRASMLLAPPSFRVKTSPQPQQPFCNVTELAESREAGDKHREAQTSPATWFEKWEEPDLLMPSSLHQRRSECHQVGETPMNRSDNA
ncbi:unnamed protein product, partial [Chrysoparadoxa australica]